MKKNTVTMALLFVAGMLTAAFGEAIVTLKSGAVVRGEIISDTNDVLQIRAFNSNRTISSLRNFPRSDVQNVQIETPAEAAERIDYFALSKFQLDPDQEQSQNFYAQWTAAFEQVPEGLSTIRQNHNHPTIYRKLSGRTQTHSRWRGEVRQQMDDPGGKEATGACETTCRP